MYWKECPSSLSCVGELLHVLFILAEVAQLCYYRSYSLAVIIQLLLLL